MHMYKCRLSAGFTKTYAKEDPILHLADNI